jgi:hypothetical protein
MEHGLFAEHGLDIAFETTPSSVYQAEKLAAGAFDIAFTAFDNVVAYSEGQGAAKLDGDPEFRVIMGATQLELAFVVAPEIERYADLKGPSIALDAVSTGFAFVLYAMLDRAGLAAEDYSFAAVGGHARALAVGQGGRACRHADDRALHQHRPCRRLPCAGEEHGCLPGLSGRHRRRPPAMGAREFRSGGTLHPRLSRRPRLDADAGEPGSGQGAASPQHATDQARLRRCGNGEPAIARSGLTPDGAVLPDGMETVLALRSRYGEPKKQLSDAGKYLELGLYQQVLAERR